MTKTPDELSNLKREAQAALSEATTAEALEAWRIAYLGRKGAVPLVLREVKKLPLAERKAVGQTANQLRRELEELYEQKRQVITPSVISPSPHVRGDKGGVIPGHLHPITLTIRRVQDILIAMGFHIAEGPEIEATRYNFDLLNIPLEHTARGMMDTFHIMKSDPESPDLVLRTHTSPVQLRAVLENNLIPPFKIASPGRVFRSERTDATHETTFHQFEGLAVGESITLAEFKGVIETFYSTFFGREVKIRLRPSYFPFVEPGFEVDVSCPFCEHGCRICKQTRWIEIMGAGMVHPNVLRNMNVDPDRYQGYAFGGAIDRLAMLQYGIDDIRLFWSGDIRFLKQFS